MKQWVIFSFAFAFLYGCSPKGKADVETAQSGKDSTKFFQTALYLQQDIKEVNATPYFIYKIEAIDGKRDSTAINTAVFNKLTADFFTPDINDPKLKRFYKESIFEDQTMNGFTISYTTTDKTQIIQNLDILLKDDGKTVKNIFIRKFYNYQDSSAIEQLSWKPGRKFEKLRSVQKPGNKKSIYQTSVIWNDKN